MHPYDRFARLWLPVGSAAILSTVLAVGWFTQPDRFVKGFAPDQPVAFSHALHAGSMKIPCQYCHGGVEKSRHAGIPAVSTCMNCHAVTRTESPEVQKILRAHESGKPIAWRRIHRLPDHVYFDHRPHVAAGVACQTCHGEVQKMDVVAQHMSMRMGNCLGCHRDARAAVAPDSPVTKGPEHCNACHR
jgi:hypothetical protein